MTAPLTAPSPADLIQSFQAVATAASKTGLIPYLKCLLLDSRPEPRRFAEVAKPWQWEDAARIAPAIEAVAGLSSGYTGPRSFWFTRARGHDKTSSLARTILWLLAFGPRPADCYHAAADGDQAALLHEAMLSLARLNPWLAERLDFQRNLVTGPGGRLRILTADAPTSYGLSADLITIDELTWWKKRDLFDALFSGRQKRPGSVAWIITNAGILGSWQDELRQAVRGDPDWYLWDEPRRLPTWMSEADITRERRLLARGIARRVIDNHWISPGEESNYLAEAEILACEALGRELGLARALKAQPGVEYFAGVDYGPRRDRTALSLLHLDAQERVIIDILDVIQGSPENPVPIVVVEQWMDEISREFRPQFVVDPFQLEGTIQKYAGYHKIERFEARGGKRNYEMAENLRNLVANRRIAWYPGAGSLPVGGKLETLREELLGLVLRPTSYGYRFDHEASGHDDRAVAVGMPALQAVKQGRTPWVPPQQPEEAERPVIFGVPIPRPGRQKYRIFGME